MKAFLPHLSIALTLALLVVVILNVYNPMLGLLRGASFLVLIGACALSAIATAIELIRRQRRRARRRSRAE